MRRKSSGVAVVAVLVGIAVAAVVYIASFGKSGSHAQNDASPGAHAEALAQGGGGFSIEAQPAASEPAEHTAAR